MADGDRGIWAGLGEIHPAGDEQRCWNHKIVNVLDALPKKGQPEAVQYLRAMMYAESRSACERDARNSCCASRRPTPRLPPQSPGTGNRAGCVLRLPERAPDSPSHHQHGRERRGEICKLLRVAEKSWRVLNAPHLMKELYDGKQFKDGIAVSTKIEPTRKAALTFLHTY